VVTRDVAPGVTVVGNPANLELAEGISLIGPLSQPIILNIDLQVVRMNGDTAV
jgi:hypothetical protein